MTEELKDRCIRLGVKPEQADEAVARLEANAVSRFFHHLVEEAEVKAKLGALINPPEQESNDLNGPGPRHSKEFKTFLGSLDSIYDAMPRERRLALWFEFKASKPAAPRDVLAEEMATRYGTKPLDQIPAIDRLRMVHAGNLTNKPTRAEPVKMTPALQRLTAHDRLAALNAMTEATKLRGSTREFDQTRLAALRARWPGIVE